ncbi:Uncharacterised protein [[Clostridium] sordellii]|nr:Uncharacterised protein [[Clostridium] sordellii] [Paeniclostridium sordellii]
MKNRNLVLAIVSPFIAILIMIIVNLFAKTMMGLS